MARLSDDDRAILAACELVAVQAARRERESRGSLAGVALFFVSVLLAPVVVSLFDLSVGQAVLVAVLAVGLPFLCEAFLSAYGSADDQDSSELRDFHLAAFEDIRQLGEQLESGNVALFCRSFESEYRFSVPAYTVFSDGGISEYPDTPDGVLSQDGETVTRSGVVTRLMGSFSYALRKEGVLLHALVRPELDGVPEAVTRVRCPDECWEDLFRVMLRHCCLVIFWRGGTKSLATERKIIEEDEMSEKVMYVDESRLSSDVEIEALVRKAMSIASCRS